MNTPYDAALHRLARSLFGFALLACLFAMAGALGVWLAPASPLPAFANLRWVVLAGAMGMVGVLAWACVWAFRADEGALVRAASRLIAPFRGRTAALITFGGLYVLVLVPFFALRDVAPTIVQPLHLAFAGLAFVLVLVLLTYHWESLTAFWHNSAPYWAGAGAVITGALVVMLGVVFVATIISLTGINDALRGGLDYRELVFLGDDAPTSARFWQEQARARVRWLPYSYWTVDSLEGQFVNVGASGLRRTLAPPVADGAPTVAFFGGSTVWGEGARDAYTIPSQAARLLGNARVINYGQTGYVTAQDLILFQMQLLEGNAPDVAVFYGGFNDVLSAYTQGYSGLSLQEANRAADSESGRALRAGAWLLRPPTAELSADALALVTTRTSTPEDILARYLDTLTMIERLAEAYGVRVLFVWQPALAFKSPRVGIEQVAYERLTTERAGLAELHTAVDALLRARLQAGDAPNVVSLADLFNGRDEAIFYDLIHITEVGNQAVAEALVPPLQSLLAN